ncbi:uncharacterized protein DS421_2g53580 [Arachis hypogaea]|nr:uncharacterized protein DS421_2g53580 [Arachis hypogaea]
MAQRRIKATLPITYQDENNYKLRNTDSNSSSIGGIHRHLLPFLARTPPCGKSNSSNNSHDKVNLIDEEAEVGLGLTNRYRLERWFPALAAAARSSDTQQPHELNDGKPINTAAMAAPRRFPSRAFPYSRLKRRRVGGHGSTVTTRSHLPLARRSSWFSLSQTRLFLSKRRDGSGGTKSCGTVPPSLFSLVLCLPLCSPFFLELPQRFLSFFLFEVAFV